MNYYEVLGLTFPCTEGDVKTAYRRLAMIHHPDRVSLSEKISAEEQFKKIKAAYEVLGSAPSKLKYDELMFSEAIRKKNEKKPDTDEIKKTGPDLHHNCEFIRDHDIFNDNNILNVVLSAVDAKDGCIYVLSGKRSNACFNCNGVGGTRLRCMSCHGTGQSGMNLSGKVRCAKCDGFGVKLIKCDVCSGHGQISQPKSMKIRIPPGVINGSKLRVMQSNGGGFQAADLVLDVTIKAGSWTCVEEDFFGEIEISIATALFGGLVSIESPTGSILEISIPARTGSGTTIRLVKMGLFSAEKKRVGDIRLKTRIVLPPKGKSIPSEVERAIRSLG